MIPPKHRRLAGARAAELKSGIMRRLPANTIKYGLDGMGTTYWEVPEGSYPGTADRLVLKDGKWVDG